MSEELKLIRGDKYRFRNQPNTPDLMYIRKQKFGHWHQFSKFEDGVFGKVWSQLLESDLHMLEQVPNQPADKGE